MRVRVQDGIYGCAVKVLREDIDGVGAKEREAGGFKEPVPESFQTYGSLELPRLPKNADHLAVGAQTSALTVRANSPDPGLDGALEPRPVRLPIYHELGQRLLGIPQHQLAVWDGLGGTGP